MGSSKLDGWEILKLIPFLTPKIMAILKNTQKDRSFGLIIDIYLNDGSSSTFTLSSFAKAAELFPESQNQMRKQTGGIILVQDEYRLVSSIIPSTSEGLFITEESRHKIMPEEQKIRAFYYSIRDSILRKKWSWSLQGPVAFKTQKQRVAYATRRALSN